MRSGWSQNDEVSDLTLKAGKVALKSGHPVGLRRVLLADDLADVGFLGGEKAADHAAASWAGSRIVRMWAGGPSSGKERVWL